MPNSCVILYRTKMDGLYVLCRVCKKKKIGWLQTFQDKCTDINSCISVIYE